MEAFSLCWEIIKREGERFNVDINGTTASQLTAVTAANVNYDVAHNRCSYVYRCGPINLSFAKDCFTKFFSSNKVTGYLLSSCITNPNLTICSLSKGPAFDCIALLQSFQEHYKLPLSFKNIKLISKHGAWRNTVNIMHQMITEGYTNLYIPQFFGSFEVIQGDPFVDLTEKLRNPINESNVILMMKTLNLQSDGYNPDTIISSIKVFLAALKEDAILFCIDTKPSIALITEAISAFSGTILFQPAVVNTIIQLEYMDLYKTLYGCCPLFSSRGSFLVWQKKSLSSLSTSNLAMVRLSESIKTELKDDNDSGYYDKLPKINCDSQESLNDAFYCSTPTDATQDKSKVFPTRESLKFKADQLLDHCINSTLQNTERFPLSISRMDGSEDVLESIQSSATITSHIVSVDKSVQTVPDNFFDNFESIKIAEMTEKISKLTKNLKSLLETNEMNDIGLHSQSCLKLRNCTSNSDNQCSNKHCSSKATNECCNEGLHNSCNYLEKRAMKHCSNHLDKQSSLLCNQDCSNGILSDLETNDNCNSSFNGVKIRAEQKTVPKLVIPLNNLSADVIVQIVSLISRSNENS